MQAEIFHLWVIEAPQEVAEEFPADKAGLNVLFVPSEEPYHERKVTLLNGPHTVLSPVAYLSEVNIVRDACQHPIIGQYIHKVMFDELMETLNLPKNELKKFAEDVLERFNNPFVDHAVTSIMLNSFPKYQTRDLPGLKTYLKRKGELPKGLVLGLAAIITYYKGGTRADGTEIIPNDAPEIMQLLKDLWATGIPAKWQKAYWQPKTLSGGTRRLEYRSRIDRHDYLLLKIHPRKRHAGNSKRYSLIPMILNKQTVQKEFLYGLLYLYHI